MLEALVFDVDGTLADTEQDGHRVAFNAAFEALELPWRWDRLLYRRLLEVAGGKERLKHFLLQQGAPGDVDAVVATLHRVKTERYVELVRAGAVPLRAGVARLLHEARARGLKLAIATTTSPRNVIELLSVCLGPDSPAWFAVIAAGDMVPRKKPAPDVYLAALDGLGVPAARCLAFEDSPAGLASALAAGLRTVVTVTDETRDARFEGALAVLDGLGEPGAPFHRLDRPGQGVVDVELLEAWAAQAA